MHIKYQNWSPLSRSVTTKGSEYDIHFISQKQKVCCHVITVQWLFKATLSYMGLFYIFFPNLNLFYQTIAVTSIKTCMSPHGIANFLVKICGGVGDDCKL